MADFVTDKEEFLRYKSRFNEIFINENFENNPFDSRFKYFSAFEFDFIYHELFFEGLKNFLKSIGDETVTFYTIDPSPVDYFYKRYAKYSVFEISNEAIDEELNDIMMKDPKLPSGDAIALTSDDISWFSKSNDWAIMGSRGWEVAIVGFTSEKIKQLFLESFSENAQLMFTSVEQFVDEFKEMVVFNEIRSNFYDNLIRNYQDK